MKKRNGLRFAKLRQKWSDPKFVHLRYNISVICTKLFFSQLVWLQLCAVGVWILVFQDSCNRHDGAQRVIVDEGYIKVYGEVDVDNTVDVNVENTVDVNVENTVDVNGSVYAYVEE